MIKLSKLLLLQLCKNDRNDKIKEITVILNLAVQMEKNRYKIWCV